MMKSKFLMRGLLACAVALAVSACGTTVNSTVAAWEKNTATNAIQAEVNQANAATFAMLNTPVYVLPFLQPNQRACISDLSTTDASKQMANIINATAPAIPLPTPATTPVTTQAPTAAPATQVPKAP